MNFDPAEPCGVDKSCGFSRSRCFRESAVLWVDDLLPKFTEDSSAAQSSS